MRQLWWMCSGDHVGTIQGKVCNTKDSLYQLIGRIQDEHLKRYPTCRATTGTVAARKASLLSKLGVVRFEIAPSAREGAQP